MLTIILVTFVLFGLLFSFSLKKNKKVKAVLAQPFPQAWHTYLLEEVQFYKNLSAEEQIKFQNKIKQFFAQTSITGVKDLEVTDELKLLVAASAIIPVFLFDGWEYVNLAEVIIYDGAVEPNQRGDAEQEGMLLGQVRPLQTKHVLLLSKQYLIQGFESMNGKSNVGIHEFAHLIDQADGAVDGIPKAFMSEELLTPWTKIMYAEIERIAENRSDINPYALTNHAEFFAVVCEYFFENPEKFQEKHPQLYALMNQIFRKEV
ncbi:zinc-dependent peptidase [Cytophaga aurantiaca]|uniref:M90 family metallopeptidase n=1 Tax=Cytophaga aurantiaca TaxID=29530 RepID=UPI00035D2C58|nr:M90 family metallopeptidase [Cytophaga aurantiaca]